MNDNLYADLPNDYTENINKMEERIEQLELEISALSANLEESYHRLLDLENRLPNSMILSPIFLKRAFAVLGHYFVANFLVAIPIICISIIVTLLLASMGAFGQ